MTRNWLLASLCGAALLAVAGFVLFNRSVAEPGKTDIKPQNGDKVETQNLPITQVVLFSSGVGYFQREGKVEGNARIDMTFPVQDINDLIKSMVLRDLDNGHITAVSYDNNAPIDRTLKSFAINLTSNPSFSGILNQARGEKVEVVLTQTNATQPGTMTGTVVGIGKQRQAVANKDVVETEVLNLWCADGMRAIKLSDLQRIRFLNPTIDGEFKKALETLASSHDTQKKSVSIQCLGEGSRRVKVGYVVENPIWKTSYRLVLEKNELDAKPYLQGWAVVENSTDEDWKDVRMALISGRPISFQMDLYSPLYVDRPTERLELFQSLRTVTYSGALTRAEAEKHAKVEELMKQYNAFFKEGKYVEAQKVAMQAREIEADNPVLLAAITIGKRQERLHANKDEKEGFIYKALTSAEKEAESRLIDENQVFNDKVWKSAKKREIETKLNTPVTLNFKDVPLSAVLDDLRASHGLNIWVDKQALEARGISLDRPVEIKVDRVALKTCLKLLLRKVNLTYIIRDEVLQITTPEVARGIQEKRAAQELSGKLNLGGSVQSAAQASKLGSSFQYLIEKPVQLPRQKSALLPIIAKDIEGKRVSIYNERTHPKFPLLGLQMKNTSGAHLMQGPITVYEGSTYGGDARIADLQPNEERLISYAVDLGTEVDAKPSSDNGRITSVKAVKGVIYSTTKIRESKAYTIANRNDRERIVLIEHPVRNDFKLIETAKPTETAADVYRFQIKVPAGKTVTETVTEEQVARSEVSISTQGDERIRFFLRQTVTSKAVKDALEKAMKLRWETTVTTREIAEQQRQLKTIVDDQGRLRANLREMPTTAVAYKRYLEKFDKQETQIEQYQATIKNLQGVEHTRQKAFEDFIAGLNVE